MKSFIERKIQFGILKAQQEILRSFVVKYSRQSDDESQIEGYLRPIEQLFYKLADKTKEFEMTQFTDINNEATLSGMDRENDHYVIDKALEKEFGKDIRVDSESGQFFAYCKTDMTKAVGQFLKENFPTLKYDETIRDKKSIFVNQTDWEDFLEEHNVTVPNPIEAVTQLQMKIEKEKAEFEAKINGLTNDMIDFANNDAIEKMEKVSDEDKATIIAMANKAIEMAKKRVIEKSSEDRTKQFMKYDMPEAIDGLKEVEDMEWYNLMRCVRILDHTALGRSNPISREFRKLMTEYFATDGIKYCTYGF